MDAGRYTYLLLLIGTIAIPLLLSFDKWVRYARRWKFLFPAMILPAALFIIWDIWFTWLGVWSFSYEYVLGYYLLNLPLEEWLFFVVVPFSCVFIADTLEVWFPIHKKGKTWFWLFALLVVSLLVAGWPGSYTTYTMTALLVTMGISYFLLGYSWWPHLLRSWLLCLIPFALVNGALTSLPVVSYSDAENLGVRLMTIPVEDVFYGFLLFLMNMMIYKLLLRKFSGTENIKKPKCDV